MIDVQISGCDGSDSDELLDFRLGIFVYWLCGAREYAGQSMVDTAVRLLQEQAVALAVR